MNTKMTIRNSLARLLFLSGITSPKRRGRGRLSIATFHRVLPENERRAYPFPGLAVTPEELDEFLDYFKKYFDCGNLRDQHKRFIGGESTGRLLLAITFDDAQYDNYKYARPVLARHQIKASFFVPVVAVEQQVPLWHDQLGFAILNLLRKKEGGRERLLSILENKGIDIRYTENIIGQAVSASKEISLENRLQLVASLVEASGTELIPDFARLMTFEEIASLAAEGHEIGSHSMTHCLMPECDDKSLEYEVAESRKVLQERLGLTIDTFCYPNGNSDTRTARAVSQAGYLRAVTTDWGCNGRDADTFRLNRYDMDAKQVEDSNGNFLPALLAFRMSGLYPGL